MSGQIAIARSTLERLRAHAAAAARLVGHSDALATGPLADHVDALAHELGELLGNPHLIAATVPSARSTFALDDVPELVAPDAPTASRTLITDDRIRHELAELPSAFTDDESTRPHVRQLRPAHDCPCQRAMRPGRPASTKRVETGWARFTLAAVLLALLGVLSLLTLGACQVDTAADATVIHTPAPEHARASVVHFTSPMHLTSFT